MKWELRTALISLTNNFLNSFVNNHDDHDRFYCLDYMLNHPGK